jgi:signal transduction protein with GAF and PtsI domain
VVEESLRYHALMQAMTELTKSVETAKSPEEALDAVIRHFRAEMGTLHWLRSDGLLHLVASSGGVPEPVRNAIKTVPVGKGMAGLAVERKRPVNMCNLQSDSSGDARPLAKTTAMQGSVVVPVLRDGRAVGALGIANQAERTFTEEECEQLMAIGAIMSRRF